MSPPYQPVQCYQYRSASGWDQTETRLVSEATVSLHVNGQDWLSFSCTPTHLEALAAGFLFNEGIIQTRREIALIDICHQGVNIDVWLKKQVDRPVSWRRTSGCTGGLTIAGQPGAPAVLNGHTVSPGTLLHCMDLLLQAQELYRETGGIHTSILTDGQVTRVKAEDIGRHNTIDKLAGRVLLDDLTIHPLILATTGRISSEMLQKSARLGATTVISRTSPTSQSAAMADQLGITLVGYARRDAFTVYTHTERLEAIPTGAPVPRPGGTPPAC